uniref:G protein coupled receptor 4 n=1 Tax=Elephant endotheliotropic herpesvirus 1A TaxID=759753 RepID=A0A8B6NPW9_ELHV1|nr:G protein coupled receptor 4 [Elephant endotheliotropic herpesvirus 1A]
MFLYFLTSKMLNITQEVENRFYMEYLDCQCIVGICVSLLILGYLLYAFKKWRHTLNLGLIGNDIFMLGTVIAMFVLGMIVKRFSNQYSISLLFGVVFAACFSCMFARSVALMWPSRYIKNDVFSITLPSLVYLLPQLIIALEYCLLIHRLQDLHTVNGSQRNIDFVCLCAYVCTLLLAATLISLKLTEFPKSRSQGVHGFVLFASCLMSVSIWIAWMYMFITKKYGCISWVSVCMIVSTYNAWALIFSYFCPTLYIISFKHDAVDNYKELEEDVSSEEETMSCVSVQTPSTASEDDDDELILKKPLDDDLPQDNEPVSPITCKPPPPTPNEYPPLPDLAVTPPVLVITQ